MSLIQKIDAFGGNVIGTAADLVDGDIERITDGGRVFECRYYTPAAPPAPQPRAMDWQTFNSYLVGLLGGGDAGTAALQALLEAANARPGTLLNDKLTRYFYTWFLGMTSFTKADVTTRLVSLVATSILTQNQANAVANNWPTA